MNTPCAEIPMRDQQPLDCNATSGWNLVLLAPQHTAARPLFRSVTPAFDSYHRVLEQAQRLRGRVYLADGAIQESQLTRDGRHEQEIDYRSWHVLAFGESGRLRGCARLSVYPETAQFDQLTVRRSAMARSDRWGTALRVAIGEQMRQAQKRSLAYVEVGGWALAPEARHSTLAVRMVIHTWSLGRFIGGCLGVTTATRRHGSASILRRMGAEPFTLAGETLPHYWDPTYQCEMEILRFDSSAPSARFANHVEQALEEMPAVPVLSTGAGQSGLCQQGRLAA